MTTWYDKWVQQLDRDLEQGIITQQEYNAEMLELEYDLLQSEAEHANKSRYLRGGHEYY